MTVRGLHGRASTGESRETGFPCLAGCRYGDRRRCGNRNNTNPVHYSGSFEKVNGGIGPPEFRNELSLTVYDSGDTFASRVQGWGAPER